MRYTIATFTLIAMFGVALIAAAPVARAASSLEIVTVSSSGNPVPDVPFEIYNADSEALNFKQTTGSDGSFIYHIDKAGKYIVVINWLKGEPSKETISVGPGHNVFKFKQPMPTPVGVPNYTAPVGLTGSETVQLCRLANKLVLGAKGEDVFTLQNLLRKARLLTVEPTRYYGEQTALAAKKALATICVNLPVKEIMEKENTVSTDSTGATTVVRAEPIGDAAPQYPSVTNENTKAAIALIQDSIVQIRQILGYMEKALSLLRSN